VKYVLLNPIGGLKPGTVFDDALFNLNQLRASGCVFTLLSNIPDIEQETFPAYQAGNNQDAYFLTLAKMIDKLSSGPVVSQGVIFQGVAGLKTTSPDDLTGYVTVGTVRVQQSVVSGTFSITECTFHADLEIVETLPNTVVCQIRLVSSANDEIVNMETTVGNASIFPEHVFKDVPLGATSDKVHPSSPGTYLIQIRRVGGDPLDVVMVHNAFLLAQKG